MKRPRSLFSPIDPDEIFLDAHNLPAFDTQQFEGRLEKPIAQPVFLLVWVGLAVVTLIFISQSWRLQIAHGDYYRVLGENNTLRHQALLAERGAIFDRRGEILAWTDEGGRRYTNNSGLGHLLGYLSYPTADEVRGRELLPEELVGREGVEYWFDNSLRGERGTKIEEVGVGGAIITDHILKTPRAGTDLTLAVDAGAQVEFFNVIKSTAEERGFQAGAGVVMDVVSGELVVLTSYPEYEPNILVGSRETEKIRALLTDPAKPFLNRALFGLYTPGSIIKPIIAAAALAEGVVTPTKEFFSSGELVVPNPYVPDRPSVFRDWRSHGWVNLTKALAVSSNVYFYIVGGGFGNEPGLGINRLERYARLFGLGSPVNVGGEPTASGSVPGVAWKKQVFGEDPWRLGDTYHASIGQFGFQVTPIQMVRVAAAIASGRLLEPVLERAMDEDVLAQSTALPIADADLVTVREGLFRSVREGTAAALNHPAITVAAKTGTAEVGLDKSSVNSWVIGFFPADRPRFAFALVLERGNPSNLVGAPSAMRQFIDWMVLNRPDWLG